MPEGCSLVGFSDVAMVIIAKDEELLMNATNTGQDFLEW